MSGWAVVVPVKELATAKTRLRDLTAPARADLALAMAADVVAAARACPLVAGVVVVTNDARASAVLAGAGARVVADGSDAGLNPALLDGARAARSWWPGAGIAALASDLPCLTPDDLGAVLSVAAGELAVVVPDWSGSGTTVLTAAPGRPLDPRFGPASRWHHVAAGARLVEAADQPGIRRDVDTPEDLDAAVALGVGAATRAAMLTAGR